MGILSLFWHSVDLDSVRSEYHNGSNPTQSVFREQLQFIVKSYTPISVVDFINLSENNKLIKSYVKPPVLLGFDDGFKNVINHALPILYEFKIPALFFLTAEILINSDFVPWFVEVEHHFRKTNKKTIIYHDAEFDITSERGRESLRNIIINSYVRCKTEKERQCCLDNFSYLLDSERPIASRLDSDLRFVNKEDLSNLSSESLLTVSSHAMTHRCLETLSHDEQVYELKQSDLLLRKHCPSYIPVISYPNGSFNKDTIYIAKKIYKFGFAVLFGSSYRNNYAYPRIGVQSDNIQKLTYKISSLRRILLLPLKHLILSLINKKTVY